MSDYKLGEMYYHNAIKNKTRYGVLISAIDGLAWAYWRDTKEEAKEAFSGKEHLLGKRCCGTNIGVNQLHKVRKTFKEILQ